MIRVVLVDDHKVVRTGYRRLLSVEPDIEVVGEAATSDEANALVTRLCPDVALTDLSLKGSSGLEAIRGMLARHPGLRVLVLSMHDSPGHVRQALKCGAHGYLTKFSDPAEVVEGLRQVALGRKVFSREISELLAKDSVIETARLDSLTPREFEVLRMLAQGESPQGIAAAMHLSTKTIHNYLTLIRSKLEVDSDFKLLHLAARHGMVKIDGSPD